MLYTTLSSNFRYFYMVFGIWAHAPLKQTPLFVANSVTIILFRDNCHPVICSLLQVTLVDCLPDSLVSSILSECPCLWGFMQKVYFAVQFFKAHFSVEYLYTISHKVLLKNLLTMISPPLFYRSLYSNFPGHNFLKRVCQMYNPPNTKKTIFYKSHCETVTVNTWLK